MEDGFEFDMPLMLGDGLQSDAQFHGMRRRYWISREAMLKAAAMPDLTMSADELYHEFSFDVWLGIKHQSWLRKPGSDGLVRLGVDDIDAS